MAFCLLNTFESEEFEYRNQSGVLTYPEQPLVLPKSINQTLNMMLNHIGVHLIQILIDRKISRHSFLQLFPNKLLLYCKCRMFSECLACLRNLFNLVSTIIYNCVVVRFECLPVSAASCISESSCWNLIHYFFTI